MGLLVVLELLPAVTQKVTLCAAEFGTFVVVEAHVNCQVGCDGRQVTPVTPL